MNKEKKVHVVRRKECGTIVGFFNSRKAAIAAADKIEAIEGGNLPVDLVEVVLIKGAVIDDKFEGILEEVLRRAQEKLEEKAQVQEIKKIEVEKVLVNVAMVIIRVWAVGAMKDALECILEMKQEIIDPNDDD